MMQLQTPVKSNIKITDGAVQDRHAKHDSLFNKDELVENNQMGKGNDKEYYKNNSHSMVTNLTTAKNYKDGRIESTIDGQFVSTDLPTKNPVTSLKMTELHSKNYSSVILSEQKEQYGMAGDVNIDNLNTINSNTNLPHIHNIPSVNQL